MEPVQTTNTTSDANAMTENVNQYSSLFKFNDVDVHVKFIDGEPWFIASEVCKSIHIVNVSDAVRKLDNDEKVLGFSDTLGGVQNVLIVNEAGLYHLVLTSHKAEAKKFKRWITHEVLPSIRKYGVYATDETIAKFQKNPNEIKRLLEEAEKYKQEVRTHEAELEDSKRQIEEQKVTIAQLTLIKNRHERYMKHRRRFLLERGPCLYVFGSINNDRVNKIGTTSDINNRLQQHEVSAIDIELRYLCYLKNQKMITLIEGLLKNDFQNRTTVQSTEHIHDVPSAEIIARIREILRFTNSEYKESDKIAQYNEHIRAKIAELEAELEREDVDANEPTNSTDELPPREDKQPDAEEPSSEPSADSSSSSAPTNSEVNTEVNIETSAETKTEKKDDRRVCKKCGNPGDYYAGSKYKCKACVCAELKQKRRAKKPEKFTVRDRNRELVSVGKRICPHCSIEKSIKDDYQSIISNGVTKNTAWCKDCMNATRSERYHSMRVLTKPDERLTHGRRVQYIKDGAESKVYTSLTALSDDIKITRQTISKYLNDSGGYNGYQFIDLGERRLQYVKDGVESRLYATLSELSEDIKINPHSIRQSMFKNVPYEGYTFREVLNDED